MQSEGLCLPIPPLSLLPPLLAQKKNVALENGLALIKKKRIIIYSIPC